MSSIELGMDESSIEPGVDESRNAKQEPIRGPTRARGVSDE
jgi:hypothetical protein